ncbi:MAG: polysaccharide deacetylase family protein [Defluviitaleaceae bacterium]|nr:polysaccharide deacetylase family protein [Defluviitaleaceae bacterium]
MKMRSFLSFILILLFCLNTQPIFAEETPTHHELSEFEEPLVAPAFIKPETAEVPVIMYHLVTKNGRYIGKYGISPTELENDLKYLKENGYETVVMADLIAFVRRGKNLPKKPVVLTFDDGNSGDYRYLYPLLQKYDMKAVVSVIGSAADECTAIAAKQTSPAVFPNSTWPELKEMSESGFIELQNHSYDLHGARGSGRRSGEPMDAYQKRLKEDLEKMQNLTHEMTGAKLNTFTYPLGIVSDGSEAVLKEIGFVSSLSCGEGMNYLEENNPDCLFRLKRVNRPSGVTASMILQKLEKDAKD